MPLTWSVATDWQVYDARAAADLITVRNVGGEVITSVADAVKFAVPLKEQAASNGVYLGSDVIFRLPASQVLFEPKPRDRIASGGDEYTILEANYVSYASEWRCVTRNLVLHYDLRRSVNILRATNTQDAAGSRVATFAATEAAIPASIQLISALPREERGKRGDEKSYEIRLARQVDVSCEDLVEDDLGERYEILGYRNPDRIDELQVITARRGP